MIETTNGGTPHDLHIAVLASLFGVQDLPL